MSSNINTIVYNKDCVNSIKKYSDKYFDLAIVDPPFGIGAYWLKQKYGKHFGNNDWNKSKPTAVYFENLFRVSKNQIIFGGNYFTEYLPVTNSWIFWDKGSNVIKTKFSEGELAWTSFRIPMRKIFIQWSGARKGNETGIKCIHPCQRPIALYEWMLINYANKGDLILDTHTGSGSCRIACAKYGYSYVGFEIDKNYYDAQEKRFKNYQAQKRLF